MQKKVRAAIEEMVPKAFWSVIDRKSVEQHLTGDLDDVDFCECKCKLTREEKAKLKSAAADRVDPPNFSDVLPGFLQAMQTIRLKSGARRILARISSPVVHSFAEIKRLEQEIVKVCSCTPLIFAGREDTTDAAYIRALIAVGQSQIRGLRLAFDLDGTLT